jgi:hypothetical protein
LAFTVVIVLALFYVKQTPEREREVIIREEKSSSSNERPINVNVATTSGDSRYSIAPQPLRFWNAPTVDMRGALLPPDGGMMINVPTQGLPESYQSMGVIKTGEGTNVKMLPLYGRRVAARSDRFQYYTRTDTYNPVPIPVSFNKRDCQDQVGCEEIMDGETVHAAGEKASVSIYRFDGPTYVPSVI